jgi:hypothetical protein
VADAHLLAPKLRTLSPLLPRLPLAAMTAGTRWSVSGCWIGKASLNRRVKGHEIAIVDAVA